jgi:cation-transporting ATPase E
MSDNMEITGLTSAQVQERISKGLQNKSAGAKTKNVNQILVENIFSVFNIIIFSIIIFLLVFYFISGDRRLLFDCIGTAFVAILNSLIAVIQEIRAKRALDKVNLLLKNDVTVIRDGKDASIDQIEIVVDDVLLLERGDQVVVDGRMLHSNHIEIDESLLTGESVPIFKKEGEEVLSGSFCVSGSGYYTAEKIGDQSYASAITKTAKRFKMNPSPLQVRLNFIVKALFASALFLAALEVVKNPSGFEDVDFVRRLSTILLSLVPQGLVLMASVTFALGVYRISKIGAIIQKLNAIESFANVKVVCTDKTGTLTQNKLAVNKITVLDNSNSLEEIQKLLGTYAKYSTDKNATLRTLEVFTALENVTVVDEIPFSSEKKRSLLQLAVNNEQLILVLGGFDILVEETKIKEKANQLFNEGGLKIYRNVLFGKVTAKSFEGIKNNIGDIEIEPLCIVSITDQVRGDVMEAINLFHKNNIEIKILSGDAAAAVQAVAKEIGWDIKDDELISGNELEEIKEENLAALIMQKKIFARLKPDHKLRIIKALKREKIHTAMIGDGVNDLPAIKEADLGIAMEEGSKITKEVADIVLLKNKFSLLPDIFDEGNKIVNTVGAVAKLFLTKNFMVIYLTLLSMFFMLHFPLTPRRVSLINIFAIGLPAFIIALRNANVSKALNFTKDLFSFVTISSLIIVAAAFAGQEAVKDFAVFTRRDEQMVMLSVIIFITVANFLSVTLHKGEKNIRLYSIYAIGLIGLYSFLAITNIDFAFFELLKKFYEIRYIEPVYWQTIALISSIGAALLIILQFIRRKIIFTN